MTWPCAAPEGAGFSDFVLFAALSPGPPTCSPTLQPWGRPHSCKGWLSQGRVLPGTGFVASISLCFSPVSFCRFSSALSEHEHEHDWFVRLLLALVRESATCAGIAGQFGFRIRQTRGASIRNPWLRCLMWLGTAERRRNQRSPTPSKPPKSRPCPPAPKCLA